MEGFTYQNIFDTKGIEYIFVILFLMVLIPFWLILNRRSRKLKLVPEAFAISLDTLRIPRGVFFSKNHTWMHMNKSGSAKIGLDDMLMHAAGPVNIDYKVEGGKAVEKGDLIAEIKQGGKSLKILSPLSGEVKKINNSLFDHPEFLNNHPFTEGWIMEVEPSEWLEETRSCNLGERAKSWMQAELGRFREFVLNSSASADPTRPMVVLQDGGELMDHTLQKLPPDRWEDFQNNFLSLDHKNQ
jgi:glycine cleavage system H protein